MLPDEQPSPEQIAAWRAMSGVERLRVAESLCQMARKIKVAGVRAQHPDWPEEQVNDEVRRLISRVAPKFLFESILPMLTACGEQFDCQTMTELLRRHSLEAKFG